MNLWLLVLLFLLAGVALFRLLARSDPPRGWRARFLVVALLVGGGMAAAVARLHAPHAPEAEVAGRPIQVPPVGYVTSDTCRACHPDQYSSWAASYHRTMTQLATPQSVLGSFDDVRLRQGDWTFHLQREGDELWVDMPDLDWTEHVERAPRVRRKVALTTGSHHMQAYWYESGNSRVLGLLPFIYNRELGGWMPRTAAFIQPPSAPRSELGRWNKVCLECHVVRGRLRPIDQPPGHDTHVAEFGIACEACHGPAERHVAENASPLRRYRVHLARSGDATVVQPARLAHDRSAEVCGQCHSTSIWTDQTEIDKFMQLGFAYRPGDRLADTKHIVRGKYEWNPPAVQAVLSFQMEFLENTFWSDGMNRIAGREYNGLLESPCFQRGEMSCLSCHQMHQEAGDGRSAQEWADDQLKPGMRGDLACTQCHREYEDPARVTSHTHHPASSEGSRCYNCHMPYTTYGLLKAVRSHQVESPSVATSVATGRPNGCNQCHLDRTYTWAAERLQEWYGQPVPELSADQREVAASVLWLLEGDAGQRALAVWSMGWDAALEASGRDWEGLYVGSTLDDSYDAIRYIAHRTLRRLPGFSEFRYDFTAPEQDWTAAKASAFQLWRPGATRIENQRGPLLIDESGAPRWPVIQRLYSQRDNRPRTFAE